MGRRICNLTSQFLRWKVAEVQENSFPSFDLAEITVAQFDVIQMRYVGGMTWTRIAEFEGVTRQAVKDRHDRAIARLQAQNLALRR